MPDERRIEYMPVDELVPDERNPKAHRLDVLGDSVGRFGYIEPVVLDERTGRLVAGHGRVATVTASRDAGDSPPSGIVTAGDGRWYVPVVRGWSSRSDQEAAAALVALNRSSEVGAWDDQRLFDLLDGLDDLTGVGFSDEDTAVLRRFIEATDYEGGGSNPYDEWHGMPEYDEDPTAVPYRTIRVHFQDEDACRDFDERLGGALPAADRSMWWPPKTRRSTVGLHYVSDEAG